MLVNKFVELSWIDFSSTWNNDVLSDKELVVELLNLISSDWVSIFSDTSAWLTQIMISESSVVNHLKGVLVWIHICGIVVDCWFQSFNLDWFVSWLQNDFRQEWDSFLELSFIKEKGEFGNLSVDANIQNSTELVNPFFNLLFWVWLSSSEGSVSNELWDWTVLKGLLSATNFDVDGDGSLVAWPILSCNSDSVTEFVYCGCSWGLKSFRNLSKW